MQLQEYAVHADDNTSQGGVLGMSGGLSGGLSQTTETTCFGGVC